MAGTAKKTAVPKEEFTGCWEKQTVHPLSEFPDTFSLSPATVALMETVQVPEHFTPFDILYLDTETTGLSGGAGTVAFEVGVGELTEQGFVVTQWVMRDYPEERFLLDRLNEKLSKAKLICTFNGRSFDIPLLRDRFLMNRMSPANLDKPHIDLLHLARRVWKLRLGRCNLSRLEETILGMKREDDLPGSLVPQRYFEYIKTKQFSLLEDVLEHNEQDVASLCVLLSHMVHMYEHPEHLRFGADLVSMGKSLDRFHHSDAARRCYKLVPNGKYHAASQLSLASNLRRSGSYDEAVKTWERMVRQHEGGITPYVELAKYHEHVSRDIHLALVMTEKAMLLLNEPTLFSSESLLKTKNALQYRYDRLKRKAASPKGK